MNDFVTLFDTFKNVRFEGNVNVNESLRIRINNPDNLKNMQIATVKASEVAQAGVASLGAGALAGIASYGGAMMFASASTGTAIASLSGAAATNATLAWFGGGALSAGGLGMGVGSAVLGGIVAGPVIAVAGFIMSAKAEENLAKAKKTSAEVNQAVEKMNTMIDFMVSVSKISDLYTDFIKCFADQFKPVLNEIKRIKIKGYERQNAYYTGFRGMLVDKSKVDFEFLSLKEKKTLHLSWLMAQVLYSVLSAPLLTQNGDIDSAANSVINDAKQSEYEINQTKLQIEKMPDDVPVIMMQKKNSISMREISEFIGNDANSESTVWQFMQSLTNIVNWICCVWGLFSGIAYVQESFMAAGIMVIISIIGCPKFIKDINLTSKEKTLNRLIRIIVLLVIRGIISMII